MVGGRRRLAAALTAAFAAALVVAANAGAYGWPVRPFDVQHPIRGNFGDPRTIFDYAPSADGLYGPGEFTFHNGVDICAAPYTTVYPVASGTVRLKPEAPNLVIVDSADGRTFQYDHLVRSVIDGQTVVAGRTPLGYVDFVAGHVHFGEIDFGHAVNPLQRGHLTPFDDRRAPATASILARTESGDTVDPVGVSGRVELDAEVYDPQPIAAPGSWHGMPLAPAFVAWRLVRIKRGERLPVVPLTVAADFRVTIPSNTSFWDVYARGTYQNMPRFGSKIYYGIPGRFLFRLTTGLLDTTRLKNGLYEVDVEARDERGNRSWARLRLSVFNPVRHT